MFPLTSVEDLGALPMNNTQDCNTVLGPRLGLALSGGGVRAALFTLGALLYLVDTKLNRRVSEISSVSGGSITNGFIAQRCDFSKIEEIDEFDRHASELALAITTGLLSKGFVVATYGITGLLILLIVVFSWPFGLPWWADVPWVVAFGVTLLLRGALLAQLLKHKLFTPLNRPATLGEIDSSVAHVFCATDLNSAMPVYLTNSDSHLLSPAWGRTSSQEYDLRLVSVDDVRQMPDTGRRLFIVAKNTVENTLHFRIFDGAGTRVLDESENNFSDKATEIQNLKTDLPSFQDQGQLTSAQKGTLIERLTSITGYTPRQKAAGIHIADAVRASAAFPFGIPPKRLGVVDFELELTLLQSLQRWQQLVFRDATKPTALYLADGGVWNNLGTDWFDPQTQVPLGTISDKRLSADQIIIIDATAPTAAKASLPLLRFPWIAEVLAPLRVLIVSYTSTVIARIQAITKVAEDTSAEGRPVLVRMIEPLGEWEFSRLAWLGYPESWSGRLQFFPILTRVLTPWTFRKKWIIRRLAEFPTWNARVPTTFFRIPREIAVQLLIHGYVATSEAIARVQPDHRRSFPDVERFARLLKLDSAQQAPSTRKLWVLGPRSKWDSRVAELNLADLIRIKDTLEGNTDFMSSLHAATDRQLEEAEVLSNELSNTIRDTIPTLRDSGLLLLTAEALLKTNSKNYTAAREIYDHMFSIVNLSDDSVTTSAAAQYAVVLARLDDPRAADTIVVAGQKAVNAFSTDQDNLLSEEKRVVWFQLSEAYALLGNSEAAVRCLRAHSQHAPQDTARWLGDSKDHEDDPFVRVRGEALFIDFQKKLLQQSI